MKERNYNTVLDVLTRFRAAEVEKAVKALSEDQVDVLMKYIYRGFANPTENSCGILLVWHEKVSCWTLLAGCVPLCDVSILSGCDGWWARLHRTSDD